MSQPKKCDNQMTSTATHTRLCAPVANTFLHLTTYLRAPMTHFFEIIIFLHLELISYLHLFFFLKRSHVRRDISCCTFIEMYE